MTKLQEEIIRDNLRAFETNFGKVRIEHNSPYGFYVYLPKDNETYVQFCYNIDYLNGWLYGAVQAVNLSVFRKK